jgi:hypothetical protein
MIPVDSRLRGNDNMRGCHSCESRNPQMPFGSDMDSRIVQNIPN